MHNSKKILLAAEMGGVIPVTRVPLNTFSFFPQANINLFEKCAKKTHKKCSKVDPMMLKEIGKLINLVNLLNLLKLVEL